jgi:sulfite reductase beta subunit-like hemoprotein
MDELGFTTDMCGQGFTGARYGDARNIVCCPVSGIEKNELINGVPLLNKLSDFFIGNPDFQDMPRKFKFSISGCGCDCTRAIINDLALVGAKKNGIVGFTILVGGSIGSSLPGPRLAKHVDVFIKEEDAFDVAVSTIEIHRDYSSRESKAKARFKWLLHEWGLQKFLDVLEEKIGRSFEKYGEPVFLKNGSHEGVQPQSIDGYYYVNIPLLGGVITSEDMTHFSDLADQYGNGELRLTPIQNIIIPNVKEKESFIKRLKEVGFSIEGSKSTWNSMGCASDFCGKSSTPHAKEVTKRIVNHLENYFEIKLLDEAGIKIHTSGCSNNCCAYQIAEIGLMGRLTKEEGEYKQNYDILLGGSYGVKTSLGRRVEENVPANKLESKIESLLIHYFEKNRTEDFIEFCKRSSIDELRHYLNSN